MCTVTEDVTEPIRNHLINNLIVIVKMLHSYVHSDGAPITGPIRNHLINNIIVIVKMLPFSCCEI